MSFNWQKFLGEIAVAAPVVIGTIAAIKQNPQASDFQKANAALLGASQTAQDIDPGDSALIQATANITQSVLTEIGQVFQKQNPPQA